jgi:heme/copper-type cytochrome/quinol oxidase subunit 3
MSAPAAVERRDVEGGAFARMPLGRAGMWWFLASEVMVFGALIITYVVNRMAAGGWDAERAHVNARIAAVNTLLLLTSSLTVVLALQAERDATLARTRRFLLATIGLGLGFLALKGVEYALELRAGYGPTTC